MIKIDRNKVNCPSSLDTSQKRLTRNDYKKDDVIVALLEMQNHKCCFCERNLSKLGKTAKWVEHFIAKADKSFKYVTGRINWNKANAWGNLLYSCSTCNSGKGTTVAFDSNGKRNLIDPSYCRIDPEKHVEFSIDGPAISYTSRTSLGKNTIKNLKLKGRQDVYSALRKMMLKIDGVFYDLVDELTAGNVGMANSKLAYLEEMTSARQPHASFCRQYIHQQVNKFNSYGLQKLNQIHGTQIQPITVKIANGHEVIP